MCWINYLSFNIILVPSSPPQSVLVSVTSSTAIIITWSPPPFADQNGIIREYSVLVFNANNDQSFLYQTQQNSLNVSLLSPYTLYYVTVAAVTVETGPYSQTYNITTLQDGI